MEKSLNQRYKESGTTLSYKQWRQREDEKMASFDGETPYQKLKDSTSFQNTFKEMQKGIGIQSELKGNSIFGISYTTLAVAGIVIVGAVAFTIYKNSRK